MRYLIPGLLLLLINISCNQQPTSSESTATPEVDSAMIRSAGLFKNYCSGCHGAQMQAFVDREWKYGNSPDSLYNTIIKGRGGAEAGMPSFRATFNDEQVNEMVAYIRDGIENVNEYAFQDKEFESDTFACEDFKFILDTVASGFNSVWGIAFLPNNDMIITDKSGEMYRVTPTGEKFEIEGVSAVRYENQGGLMDVEIHPDFESNQTIYISYSKPKDIDGDTLTSTAVSRFKLVENTLTEEKLIFEALPYSERFWHYGSRLEFDREGYLYVSVGDRGRRDENPQSLKTFHGKIHRINDDGSIPSDNPFVNEEGAVTSIYSYGHRNPQGVGLNPASGKIWVHEHGPRGGDEINVIRKAVNYGWPVISYGINYDGTTFTAITESEGMEQPILYWVPSIAPCGMDFVEGNMYPGWEGSLLVGSLRFEYLNLCKIEGEEVVSEEKLVKNIGRVRSVKQAPDGYIYFGVERPGAVYKIIPITE